MNINLPVLIDGLIPLVAGLCATIYAFQKGGVDESKKRRVLKKQLFWLGPLLVLFGIFTLSKDQVFGRVTPATVVAAIKKKTSFPVQVDEMTTLDSVEAIRDRVTFVATISKSGLSSSEKEALVGAMRPKIKTNLCSKYREILDAGISFEYIYMSGREMLPSIVLSKADCPQ